VPVAVQNCCIICACSCLFYAELVAVLTLLSYEGSSVQYSPQLSLASAASLDNSLSFFIARCKSVAEWDLVNGEATPMMFHFQSNNVSYKVLVSIFKVLFTLLGARGSVVGWGTMLQTGRSRVRVSMRWILFNWPNPSSRTMALGSTQPITEMSTRKIPGG
jgi:hypothetical protein